MNAQPLLFLGDKRRQALLERLTGSARRWRAFWAEQSGETFDAQCEPTGRAGYAEPVASISVSCWALDIDGEREAVLLLPHSTFLWSVHEAGLSSQDGSGTASADAIAEKLEQEVASTLFTELCALGVNERTAVTRVTGDSLADWSRHCRAWALQVRAPGAGRAFTLLLSANRLEMLAPARIATRPATLASRREAVSGNSIALRAVVGELEMSVSELAGIAIDDVLVLEQHLAEPVALFAAQSRAKVVAGNLGRAGARRAIKISAIKN